jgi:hypothetical protein
MLAAMITYDRPANITAFQAISEAQKLAFSPIAFQASVALVRLGILRGVADAGERGTRADELAERLGLDSYGVSVLLDMGLSIGLVWHNDDRYVLDKIGHFMLDDSMTRVNLSFVADVCYRAMERLQESIERHTPCGLEQFGSWITLYPGLTQLPEPARTSWFTFDHFYSAAAFGAALPIVFKQHPRHIADFGGNTGAWARACAAHDAEVMVTIVDLPEQLKKAELELQQSPYRDRIALWAADVLDGQQGLPAGADVIWMSQFLDCFSASQIEGILSRARDSLPDHGSLFVLELLWDRQQHDAAAYSVNATSLYFTCIANGVSRMYGSAELQRMLLEAGFEVAAQHDHLGLGHSLFHCVKRK